MTAFRIHSHAHGRAVLDAARVTGHAVCLVSPPLTQAGIGWWRQLRRLLAEEFGDVAFQAVADCGPSPGLALAAIRAGTGPVRLETEAAMLAKIVSIAEQAGTRAEGGGEDTLDLLGVPDPGLYCRRVLKGPPGGNGSPLRG